MAFGVTFRLLPGTMCLGRFDMNEKKRNRIRGLFLGIGIGDALGMPVETWTRDRIRQKYGVLKEYVSAAGHKWFDGEPVGSTHG